MKVKEILDEGYHISQDGDRVIIDYDPNPRDPDDPWFTGVASSRVADKPRLLDAIHSSAASSGSQEEIDELESHISQKGGYQKIVPLYWAMPVGPSSPKRQTFLDALKGRAKASFTEDGLRSLIQDGAKRIFHLIATHEKPQISKADNIFIFSVPSSGKISYALGEQLTKLFSQKYNNVEYFPKALFKTTPKIGMISRGGKRTRTPN